MTRKTFTRLIEKTAAKKRTALDRAMGEAAKLGKPTTAGLAGGIGLGSILAAAGALARDGDSNPSILTNPLLLGALGATGGYLAGNAFDRLPTKPDKDYSALSKLSLLGLTAGVGIPGSAIAGEDIAERLMNAENYYKATTANMLPKTEGMGLLFDVAAGRGRHGRRLSRQELEELGTAGREYADAMRRAGRTEEASILAREFRTTPPPQADEKGMKLIRRAIEKARFSKYSPYRWAHALNPMKGKKLLDQLGRFASKNRTLAGIAGGSLLLGSGGLIANKLLNRD